MKKAIFLLAVIASSFSAFAGDKNKLESPDPAMAITEKVTVASCPGSLHKNTICRRPANDPYPAQWHRNRQLQRYATRWQDQRNPTTC